MEKLLKQARLNKDIRNHCKERIDGSIELYKKGLITLDEFIDGISEYESMYKLGRQVENDLITETKAYSDERYRILDALH